MNTTEMRMASNRVRDIERYFHQELDAMYGVGEVDAMLRMLFEAYMGWDPTAQLLHRDDTVNQSDLLRFHWAAEDLKRWRPIQHIIGWTEFCGCRIAVDEHTLIPRPETEEMVERIVAAYGERDPRHVIDLCTGSGCIAIALAKRWPGAEVIGVDVSGEALAVAERNAADNGVTVRFVQADILDDGWEEVLPPYPFDLIVSNPPYVRESERKEMSANVKDFEPGMALFVPDETPLVFYEALARFAQRRLAGEGQCHVEINEALGGATAAAFEAVGMDCEIRRDFRGKERVVSMARSEQRQ